MGGYLAHNVPAKEHMSAHFTIPSSDPALLERATRLAEDFAGRYIGEGMVGVAFLGAVARGYFDAFADIDVVLYRETGADISIPENYIHEDGFEIHCWLSDYAAELEQPWDMPKRWAFSTHRIFYDPRGLVARLFAEKVPLRPDERRWLMIEGMSQSNWYIDTLPQLWAARGSLASAQHMFHEGLAHFYDALFGLNDALVADVKWRYYCAERLPVLPARFPERIAEVLCLRELTEAESERRRLAFMELWQEVLPLVEAEVGMPFEAFSLLV
jgi:hypothetical protein